MLQFISINVVANCSMGYLFNFFFFLNKNVDIKFSAPPRFTFFKCYNELNNIIYNLDIGKYFFENFLHFLPMCGFFLNLLYKWVLNNEDIAIYYIQVIKLQ